MSARAISVVVISTLLAGVAYLQFATSEMPVPPAALPVISNCKELRPGMRRIGDRWGLQFDVPVKDFTIAEGWGDAPMGHGFNITPNNSKASLIVGEASSVPLRPPDPILASLGRERKILGERGATIGRDSWGYWGQGERWRHVYFRGVGLVDVRYGSKNEKDAASYGSVHEHDAALFDHIINSACWLSSSHD
jgi:hypothetical protein